MTQVRKMYKALALAWMGLISSVVSAHELELTIYDDGRSCPGNCDAHAVLNAAQNGTLHAYLPGTRSNPKKCRKGEMCKICFGHSSNTCMAVLYRGSGPPSGKVDFTPAFYRQHCGVPDIPKALVDQCAALDRAVSKRKYHTKLNCVSGDTSARCVSAVAKAQSEYDADDVRIRCTSVAHKLPPVPA
jgi:hypothetical protein